MKVKTSEIDGRALNLAVMNASGTSWWTRSGAKWDRHLGYTEWVLDTDGVLKIFIFDESASRAGAWVVNHIFDPCHDWSQGGPIIDKRRISVEFNDLHQAWVALMKTEDLTSSWHTSQGDTALTAVMRCFVASKLGDEVEVPESVL